MSCEIFTTAEKGHAVIMFDDFVIHFSTKDDVAFSKYKELLRIYGAKAKHMLVESRHILPEKQGWIYIQDRGQDTKLSSAEDIQELFILLKKLHALSAPRHKIFSNKYLSRGKYDPDKIWATFYHKQTKQLLSAMNYQVLNQIRLKYLEGSKRLFEGAVALIHGDVHSGNVVKYPDGMRLIDWSDTRIDNKYLDIAQVIFQTRMSKNRANMLLNEYEYGLKYEHFLYFILLLILFVKLNLLHDERNAATARYWAKRLNLTKLLKL